MRGLSSVTDNWPNPSLGLPEDTKTTFHDEANPQSGQNIPKADELSDSLSFCHFAQKKRSFDIPFGHPAPPPNSQRAANTVFIVSEVEVGW